MTGYKEAQATNTAYLQELLVVEDCIFTLTSGCSGGVTGTLLTVNIPNCKQNEGITIV